MRRSAHARSLRGSRLVPLVALTLVATCGCGSSAPPDKADTPSTRRALRTYLRAWETSWYHLGGELSRGDEDPGFSDTPDASWGRARRYYGRAATAYRHADKRFRALRPPRSLRAAHAAYVAAVGRQEARFQALADAFAGTDPSAMERALEALERSQLKFDLDGARWEEAVVSACRSAGLAVPEIVRRELVSNGQRAKIH
jgi:hypothetical protein